MVIIGLLEGSQLHGACAFFVALLSNTSRVLNFLRRLDNLVDQEVFLELYIVHALSAFFVKFPFVKSLVFILFMLFSFGFSFKSPL